MLYFKHMSGSDSNFPKSDILLVHLALFNFMWLHDVFYGSLGLIKFDIKLVVSYFFKNLLLFLILKSFVHYSGLPLLAIFACDMLWLTYFKEVVNF